jgi:phenylacetate-CoA ligase
MSHNAVDPDPAERLSEDELHGLQLARLRRVLRHAYDNIAHYRQAFDAAGRRPEDCHDLADLATFPLTTNR